MSKTASSMKGPHCFLRVTHFTWLKPLHPKTQVNLSASQPTRQVPLTVCTHSIHSVPPSACQHGLSITTKPPIDIYTVIYKILLRLLIRCAPHWSFLICIKIPEWTDNFTPWQLCAAFRKLSALTSTCSLALCSPLLAVFAVPSVASEAAPPAGALSFTLLAFLPAALLPHTRKLFSCLEAQVLQWEPRDTLFVLTINYNLSITTCEPVLY